MKIKSWIALEAIAASVLAATSVDCQALTKPDYPVIFIHGIAGSANETWGDFANFLVSEGWQPGGSPTYSTASKQVSSVSAGDFYTMNMSDYNSLPFKSQSLMLSEQGWEVAAIIAKVLSVNPGKTKVILVAHSMGGLAARSYLQSLAKKDGVAAPYRTDVAKLVTLSTPHQGTELATVVQQSTPAGALVRLLLNLKADSVGVRELVANSPALITLNDLRANPLPIGVSYVSIIGTGTKLILFPQTGDGIVSAVSQNLANTAGVANLTHTAKEIFVLPRPECDPVSALDAAARSLLNLGPTEKGIGHLCATTDGGVWAELIRQFRPTGTTTDGSGTVNASTGSVDPSFSPLSNLSGNALTGTRIYAVTVQGDGKTVVGGAFTSILGATRNYVARLNADGSLDTSFNPGSGANSTVNAMLIQPDGKILIAGQFTTFDGVSRNRVARLNSDGSLDTSFNPGSGASAPVFALISQSDGKVLIGGAFTSVSGVRRKLVARLNSNGTLDGSFDISPSDFLDFANGTIYALALQPNGQVVAGGEFSIFDNNAALHQNVIRLNSNGTLDTMFLNQARNPNAREPNSIVYAISLQTDGRILIGGGFSLFGSLYQAGIARLTTDGSFDTSFNPGLGVRGGGAVASIAQQSDGKLYVGGDFNAIGDSVRYGLARLQPNGGVDSSFNPTLRSGSLVKTIAFATNGNVILGGDFSLPTGRAFTARIQTFVQDPVISSQPESHIVIAGGNAVLSVSAAGTAPLAYQWRFNGTNMPGATDSILFLSRVTAVQSGDYTVVVSNAKGAVTSVAAKLTVNNPPDIPTNVLPANGANDQSLTLTLEASEFSDPDRDSFWASQWQVLSSTGSTVVWDSGEDTKSWWISRAVPFSAGLAYSTTYRWQVRYKDRRDAWSAYSLQTSFTTTIPLQPRNPVQVGTWPGYPRGSALAVAVAEGYAYVAVGEGGLQIFDVRNPSLPVRAGSVATSGYAQGVAISGKYAYVADGDAGLQVIDVSNPAVPRWVSNPAVRRWVGASGSRGYARGVAVSGKYAYVAEDYGLQVIDVSNSAAPLSIGSLDATDFYVWGVVAISGNYAYMAGRDGGLVVIDVSNPAAPTRVGGINTGLLATGIALLGNYAYVTGLKEDGPCFGFTTQSGGCRVIDVSNPIAPKWVASLNTTDRSARGVTISGNYAYVASEQNGLMVVDAKNPTAPTTVGYGTSARGAAGVAVSGNYAYVARDGEGLTVFDVGNPREPKQVSDFEIRGVASSVAVFGNYAYVADGRAGLQVIDVSNAATPKRIGSYDTSGRALDVAVSGSYAYVADGGAGLLVIDVSKPDKPVPIGVFVDPNCGWAYAVALSGKYAYVAYGSAGLLVLDISNPARPTLVGETAKFQSAEDVVVSGNYAYVADQFFGLEIIDVSNPATPKLVRIYNPYNRYASRGLAISGKYAYLATYNEGLIVIDLSNPLAPRHVSRFDSSDSAITGVAVSGNYAYVANGQAGLQVIDVSNPAAPRRVGGFDTSGSARGVAVFGDYAYVADGAWGLAILKIGDLALPVPKITLSAVLSGREIVLSWPASASGFVLEVSDRLAPASWTSVSQGASLVGAVYSTRISLASGSRFYRLRAQ